jgi:hypothetical protein
VEWESKGQDQKARRSVVIVNPAVLMPVKPFSCAPSVNLLPKTKTKRNRQHARIYIPDVLKSKFNDH